MLHTTLYFIKILFKKGDILRIKMTIVFETTSVILLNVSENGIFFYFQKNSFLILRRTTVINDCLHHTFWN